jgi:hypothetical protein
MRRRTARPLACALLLGAAALGAACNAILGNEDATAPDASPGADGAPPDGPTTPVDGGGRGDGDATAAPDTFVLEAGDAVMAPDAPVSADGGPEVLWSDIDDPRAVAVDVSNVYWIDAHNVYQCPLGGCSPAATLLTSGGGSFVGILADGHYLYFTDETRHMLAFCDVSTKCMPSSLASATQPHGLAHDGQYLYVTHVASGDIAQGPIDAFLTPASMTSLISGLIAPTAMAVDGSGNVYWTEGLDAGSVQVCQLPQAIGCMPMQVFQTTTPPGELVADVNGAYATVPGENRIVSIDISAFTAADFATSQHHPTYVALDAKYVYWVDLDGLKACPRATVPCTAPKLLTPLPLMPGGIAVVAGFVYGALRAMRLDGAPAATGAVYRFPAPP